MGAAFCAAAVVAVLTLAVFGSAEPGTDLALQATARFSFLLFSAAYAGSGMAALFGPTFDGLKRHGRDFGLAFASAHLVHMGLVAWLCWIGAVPKRGVFVFFGIALFFTYLLALLSIKRVQQMLSRRAWWVVRTVGMNYIAYAFFVDFLKHPLEGSAKHVIEYAPFVTLSIAGAVVYFAALALPAARRLRARVAGEGVARPSL